jgi:hypothetical protein
MILEYTLEVLVASGLDLAARISGEVSLILLVLELLADIFNFFI